MQMKQFLHREICWIMNAVEPDGDDEWDNWFYGPPEVRPKRKRAEYAKEEGTDMSHASKACCSSRNISVTQPKWSLFDEALGCFNVFKRQRDALQKRSEWGPKSRIFSFEHPSCPNGKRQYLVTTVERFWPRYETIEEGAYYELIPDEIPVRLFFDLEFYREPNPQADEKTLIAGFNDCVKKVVEEEYGIKLDCDQDMLVLDSSTASKFSEHIIVHLPGSRLFPSCVSIKNFITLLEKEMLASGRGLVFNTDGTKKIPLCDTGVYTLNRNFRIYLSCKLGKNNPLKLAARCRFYEKRKQMAIPKRIFLDSLVVPAYEADPEVVLHDVASDMPSKSSIYRCNILDVKTAPVTNENFLDFMSGYGSTSPFPILEDHILDINRRWRAGVSVRTWKMSKNLKTGKRLITYYLAGCRFCFNVDREHRSNGVYWIVDLDGGFCYQKCFDVDCRGTSSNHFPLPYFVRASIPSVEEVEKATTCDAAATSEQSVIPLIKSLKDDNGKENTARFDESLRKIRRRSAALEKMGASNVFDSFYDEDEDQKLLALVEEFEDS